MCAEQRYALDFAIQPIKQILSEIVDCNPCSMAMPPEAIDPVYSVLEQLAIGLIQPSTAGTEI